MHGNHGSYGIHDRKARLLYAARLISGFGTRYSSYEVYERALSCYDLLIDAFENPGVARELSGLVHMPANKLQASAEAIIDRLLFNQKNNPYISLGFQGHASASEVTRRWKRLIILYHPDRYPNQKKYEERAKKINQAYAEIKQIEESDIRHEVVKNEVVKNVRKPALVRTGRIHYFRYMKRLPAVIIAAAVLIALISMLLFVSKLRKIHSVAYPHKENQEISGNTLMDYGFPHRDDFHPGYPRAWFIIT